MYVLFIRRLAQFGLKRKDTSKAILVFILKSESKLDTDNISFDSNDEIPSIAVKSSRRDCRATAPIMLRELWYTAKNPRCGQASWRGRQ
jgi:hypothetical protein